jgi:hypothetical protein
MIINNNIVTTEKDKKDAEKQVSKRVRKTKITTNKKKDVGDPTFDLIRVFEKRNIAEMDDTELTRRITMLQQMRLIRVTAGKRVTALDTILSNLTLAQAQTIVALDIQKRKEEDTI